MKVEADCESKHKVYCCIYDSCVCCSFEAMPVCVHTQNCWVLKNAVQKMWQVLMHQHQQHIGCMWIIYTYIFGCQQSTIYANKFPEILGQINCFPRVSFRTAWCCMDCDREKSKLFAILLMCLCVCSFVYVHCDLSVNTLEHEPMAVHTQNVPKNKKKKKEKKPAYLHRNFNSNDFRSKERGRRLTRAFTPFDGCARHPSNFTQRKISENTFHILSIQQTDNRLHFLGRSNLKLMWFLFDSFYIIFVSLSLHLILFFFFIFVTEESFSLWLCMCVRDKRAAEDERKKWMVWRCHRLSLDLVLLTQNINTK